ncbi:MAG: hypothetical protein ACHQEM_05675 [Chitinophagales bacterium]
MKGNAIHSLYWWQRIMVGESKLIQQSRLTMLGCLFLCTVMLSGCFLKFYKTNSVNSVDSTRLEKLIQQNKYFILRANDGAFAMVNLKVGMGYLNAMLDTLAAGHGNYLDPKKPVHNRFLADDKHYLLDEVHIYIDRNVMSPVHIPLSGINRMDVYELDRKNTRVSTIQSIVGLSVSISATAIVLLFASRLHQYP